MKRSIVGRSSDVPTQRRRSSILKTVRAPRTPLAELDTKPITPTDQTVSRRVSFSRRTGVAEFITHEATTTWKNVYEEHHNFTVDSFVNDSDGRPSGGPGRLFQGEFQDVEAELDAVDEPPVLALRDTQGHQATASINLTEQFAALETVSNHTHNPAAPLCHFEVSARTDNNLKPFGDDITEFIIGERSGVIEVDFSAVEPIQASNECNENNSLDVEYLEEAERDCAHTNRLPLNLKSELNSAPEYGEADMSLTDTVRPPCVGPPAIPRVLCNTVPKPGDWITDKENILLTPPQKTIQSTIKTQDKVLVYDGKKLKYASIDDDLDELEDPLPRINKNHAHINNKREDKSMSLGVARTNQQQTNTLIFDRDDLGANISITECIPFTAKNYHNESKDEIVNVENMNLTAGVSQRTSGIKNNMTFLGDDANISITRCALTVEQDYIQSRNCVTTDSKYIRVSDDNVPIVQCLPPGLRSSVISTLISGKKGNNTSNRNSIMLDKDDVETKKSLKLCDNGRLVLNKKIENPSLCKTQETSSKNRHTMLLGEDNVSSDISIVKYADIVEDENVRTIEQNISTNNKRRTILFEQDNADADMSVTQCANIKIIGNKNLTNPNQNISTNNKRRTILFEQDNADADMSVTQCANIKIIGNKNLTNPNQNISTNNKRRTILFEQDNTDADMSVTQCANIKIIGNKNLTNPNQNISTNNKRRTILFEQDNADADMSVTQCANIKVIEDENVTNANQGISTDKKRHTILFEPDNLDADMSVTQCANIKIIGDNNITSTSQGISADNKRHTILFECDNINADMSVTQCANSNQIIGDRNFVSPNLDIATDNKACTILFDQDNVGADMSVTQCDDIKIIGDKNIINSDQYTGANNKRRTILLEKDDMDANMSVTRCATIQNIRNKNIINLNQIDTNNKRDTILFEQDNMAADMSVTYCDNTTEIIGDKNIVSTKQDIVTNNKRHTIVFEQDNAVADMSVTQCAKIKMIGEGNITNPDQNVSTNSKRRTVLFEQNNVDADLSATQCADNIQIFGHENVTNPDQDMGTNKRHTIVFEHDNVDADMSVTQCADIQIFRDENIKNSDHDIGNKRRTILYEKEDMDADMSVTQCSNINVIDAKGIVSSKQDINNGKRHTLLFEGDGINANTSTTRSANIHILGVKNIIRTKEADHNDGNTIFFENNDSDIDADMQRFKDKSVTSTSVSKTDNASSDNPKRAAILFEKDDHFSMSHCENVRRIVDRDITYVTVAKTDHGVDNSNNVNVCENDNKSLRNIQSVKSPNIVCQLDTSTNELIKGTHNNSLRFEDCIIKGEQQYLNEINITSNESSKKNNAFEEEMLETEDIPNTYKSQNDVNTNKIDGESLNDSKRHNIVAPHIKRKEISLVLEKDDNDSVRSCGPARAKSFLESIPRDLNSPQGMETNRYTLELDKISKSFHAFDLNEPQALTVCAPVQVKYKPDRSSSSRLKTVHQKLTYDAELQTQNIENKHTSQDNISYSNVDAINSSKKSVLNQLLDMSTDPLNASDERELLEIEEEEEETIPESSDEDKSSQITSATEELIKSNRQGRRCSSKRELDLESAPSVDSAPKTGVSDSSLTTSDECANALAAKLDRLNDSKFEPRKTLNRHFESVISAVTEDPNDTAELLEALDHLTEPNSKSINKSHRLNTIDSCTITDDIDLSRKSVAVNVNSELKTLRKPSTEDSAVGPDVPDEWARRRTLRFQDEIDAERNYERLSPLKKTHCLETSHVESVPQKIKIIPKYLNEMSDGVKELMSDLMKPMVDMLPHTSVCAAPVPDHETRGEQADLAVSSQVSSMHEMEPIYPVHQSSEDSPTPQTPPNPRTPSSHLRHDIAEAARRAVNRALNRRKSFEPPSVDTSPKSSRSEDEEEILEPRSASPPRVLTFDKENPLNNILLRPYVPSELPSASPSAHDRYCVNESTSSSREAIDPTNLHYCPKHGVHTSQKPIDIGCLTVEYDMQKSTAHSANTSAPSSAPVRTSSPSPLLETRVAELKDTEVNTFIAMKTNAQLLHADSELTVADAGDPPLTVSYRCRSSPVETSESELNLPARPLKRPHVTPTAGTPSPRPPQKVHRRPTSPKTLMNTVLTHNSPTRVRRTSASPPSKGSSPMHSSQTNKTNKSLDKIGSFSSSREHEPLYAPVYTAPVSPPSNLRAQIDALPFMGSRDCEWETAVTRAERGETHRRGAWWWFRLLHSRLRLGIRIAHVAGASPEGDSVLAELVVTADLHGCRDPVVSLCVRLAAEAARAVCAKETGATAGRTPLLLQRLANLSRLAAQWGRALHDARLSLALAVEEHGAVSFNVANVPLRCVWEVRMHVELSPPEEPTKAPWPRAARVTARLASPGRAAALGAGEVQGILSEVPHNWGHVPTTIWRVFRYLKNKTHYEALLRT